MTRRDAYLDAMLRELGAAYYASLHGKADKGDVARALKSVAEHIGDKPVEHAAATESANARQDGSGGSWPHRGRWHSRVRDVMTTSVVTVGPITPYKEIVRLLAEHKISGMPVLSMDRHVAGVVSEADLLAAQSKNPAARRWWLTSWPQRHRINTAEKLMTSPAITVQADATIATAARLMSVHHLRRLPVVDSGGVLLGIVSRRDLLSVFLRPDSQIARQVGEILTELLPGGPTGIQVSVRDGVVSLTGEPELAAEADLIPVAVRLAWDLDAVVDVVDKTGPAAIGRI
jgi:CBS domain-containing protein